MEKMLVDSPEKLAEEIVRVREAQKQFSTYTQEQVDKIFFAAAMAANKARIPLAKLAYEETGINARKAELKVIRERQIAEWQAALTKKLKGE